MPLPPRLSLLRVPRGFSLGPLSRRTLARFRSVEGLREVRRTKRLNCLPLHRHKLQPSGTILPMGLDAVEIVPRCEELFSITLADDETAAVRTVDDLYRLICTERNPTPRPPSPPLNSFTSPTRKRSFSSSHVPNHSPHHPKFFPGPPNRPGRTHRHPRRSNGPQPRRNPSTGAHRRQSRIH